MTSPAPPGYRNGGIRRVTVLGSTGSIGQSTLSIVEQFPERYSVAALAAGRNVDEAFAQAVRWRPQVVSMATEELAAELASRLLKAGASVIKVVHGTQGTVTCSTLPEVDFVVSAIVGVSGLEATHAAILAGKPVGGMMQMTDDIFPAEVPPHWGVCFAVADCDDTVAKARALGATVTNAPMDMPIGRFAGLIDPQGASFTVMQPAQS